MYLSNNNHRLYYEIHGPEVGQPVVLLHHGLGSVQAWRAQIPVLAEAGYRVIAYDRWGYGRSEPRPHLTLPGFEPDREDLAVVLQSLELERPVLIGHSDGGTIALYFAAHHPERVERLVTVAAHIYLEPKMEPGIEGVRQAYEQDRRFRQGMRRVHGPKADQVFTNWYDGWTRQQNPEWDMRPILPKIACPALIIQGRQDEHATDQHARDIAAAIPGAELWLAPEAAHMLPQEQPDPFNQKILDFLEQGRMTE